MTIRSLFTYLVSFSSRGKAAIFNFRRFLKCEFVHSGDWKSNAMERLLRKLKPLKMIWREAINTLMSIIDIVITISYLISELCCHCRQTFTWLLNDLIHWLVKEEKRRKDVCCHSKGSWMTVAKRWYDILPLLLHLKISKSFIRCKKKIFVAIPLYFRARKVHRKYFLPSRCANVSELSGKINFWRGHFDFNPFLEQFFHVAKRWQGSSFKCQ